MAGNFGHKTWHKAAYTSTLVPESQRKKKWKPSRGGAVAKQWKFRPTAINSAGKTTRAMPKWEWNGQHTNTHTCERTLGNEKGKHTPLGKPQGATTNAGTPQARRHKSRLAKTKHSIRIQGSGIRTLNQFRFQMWTGILWPDTMLHIRCFGSSSSCKRAGAALSFEQPNSCSRRDPYLGQHVQPWGC